MIDTREDQPAFPRSYSADGHNGMTLRDYFAGQALAGMAAQAYVHSEDGIADCAEDAYALADAMLAERAKASTVGEQDR